MRDGVVGWQVSGSTGLPPRVAAVFAALLTVSGILTVLHLAISLSTPLIYNCIVVQPERAATLASVIVKKYLFSLCRTSNKIIAASA